MRLLRIWGRQKCLKTTRPLPPQAGNRDQKKKYRKKKRRKLKRRSQTGFWKSQNRGTRRNFVFFCKTANIRLYSAKSSFLGRGGPDDPPDPRTQNSGKFDQNRRKIVDFWQFLHIFNTQNRPLKYSFHEKCQIFAQFFSGGGPPRPRGPKIAKIAKIGVKSSC